MRQIKFRAWDNDFKVMIPRAVVYDNENIILVDVSFDEAYGHIYDARCEKGVEEAGPEHLCINGYFSLMQFTGLHDKNEKEIYEGDIIDFDRNEWGGNDNIHVVTWDEEQGAWDWGGGSTSDMEFRTVIGNIYEHPHLLNPTP